MIEGRDGISVGTATLASGKATISTSALTHGARSRTVVYSGSVDDVSNLGANSELTFCDEAMFTARHAVQ